MPTPLHNRLRQAPNFQAACLLMAEWFANTARVHARQCQQERVPYDSQFWPACRDRAERAASIHAAYMERARLAAADHLRRECLEEYADALESGDYAQHLDLPEASG